MEEGYLIYIFAIRWKARISFKIQRKSCLKISSANRKCLGAPGALCRDVARAATSATAVHALPAMGAHAEGPEYPLVAAPRRRAPVRDVHNRWGRQVARPHSPVRRLPRAISRRGACTSPGVAAHTARALIDRNGPLAPNRPPNQPHPPASRARTPPPSSVVRH
jgi:hypothetical protein